MHFDSQATINAVTGIGDFIDRISQIASTIAAAVEEQDAATKDIARNVQHAAEVTTQVAGHVREVASSSLKTGAASSQLLIWANSLTQSSDRLKLEVDGFLAGIRA